MPCSSARGRPPNDKQSNDNKSLKHKTMTTQKNALPERVAGNGGYCSPEVSANPVFVESGFCNSTTSEGVESGKDYCDWTLNDSGE